MRPDSSTTGGIRRLVMRTLAIGAFAVAGLIGPSPVGAQEPLQPPGPAEAAAPAGPISPAEIAGRRDALSGELDEAEAAIAATRDESLRAHRETLRDELREIDALLRQQAELAEAYAQPPREARALPDVEPPSIGALDRLYELQFENEREIERRAAALAASREALAIAKERLEEAERSRREARDELEAVQASSERPPAERTLRIRQLESRVARERVNLLTLETRLARRVGEQVGVEVEIAERIAAMRDALARGENESDDDHAERSRRELEIRRSREAVERRLKTAELRFQTAQTRLSEDTEPTAESQERVDALAAERDAFRMELELIDSQLDRLEARGEIWRRWEAVLRGQSTRDELDSWKSEAAERTQELEQAEWSQRGRLEDLERRLAALEGRLRVLSSDSPIRDIVAGRQAVLSRLLEAEKNAIAAIAHDRRFTERFLAELRDRTGETQLLEYVVRGARATREFWRTEIATVDDASITVGSLVLALLFAGLGLWISRRGSGWIARIATGRFKLDAGAAHALQTLSFYVLLVSFTLLALRAVHFPLTAFTVLGGALAIGIGFGSQNVMNNFISGLILMLERPVRARDIVEVDGNHGTIEKIGARSTQIRSHDGRHIIVPNSFFLESNVVNWTLSDDLIRTSVKVGVVYGSPTRLVEELIQRVVSEDEKVLAKPAPIVIFDEFGDNSLDFEVHFWVKGRSPMEVRIVQSRVRFRIDDLFREHELVIAFPQRDVHVDSASPIEVRLTDAKGKSTRSD